MDSKRWNARLKFNPEHLFWAVFLVYVLIWAWGDVIKELFV